MRKPSRPKPITTPSVRVETPIGAAIIHLDALLESFRKKRTTTVPATPKWIAILTKVQRKHLKELFRQTYIDMRIAAKGMDQDLEFAYNHYSLKALRTACEFFAASLFERAPADHQKLKRPPARVKRTAKEKTFADLFPTVKPKKNIVRKK